MPQQSTNVTLKVERRARNSRTCAYMLTKHAPLPFSFSRPVNFILATRSSVYTSISGTG